LVRERRHPFDLGDAWFWLVIGWDLSEMYDVTLLFSLDTQAAFLGKDPWVSFA
jgi:hypothetical protein